MRTTLTIDDDLARALREKAHKTGAPFKEVVNKAIRTGLEQIDKPKQIKPYKCKAYSLAIEHGARLYSTDNDFSRFRSLRWSNPIE